MTVVVGMTELLLISAEDGEQKRFLQSLKQAADSLLRMLEEAVDFSRLEAGAFALDEREFVLTDVVRLAQESLAAAALQLSPAIDQAVPERLVGDADRLRQMIEALTRSAAKFRPTREYDLRVTAEPSARGVVLDFSLAQKGALAERGAFGQQPGPFDLETGGDWVRLADFAGRGYSGSGLGLPIAAGLAELMAGGLWISDDAHSPLVFRVTARFSLPGENSGGDLLAAVEERLAEAPNEFSSLHVLLAEDTAANREFFRSVLEQRGHTVVAVANGEQALEAFQSRVGGRPFDLLLIDVEMPVMDGRETAATLRSLDAFAARPLPLVALTAHQTASDSEFSQGALFDAALTKPCELAHFYAVIEGLARGRRPVGQTRPRATAASEQRIDHRGTMHRLGGNEQLFYDLVRFFLEDAPVVLAELGTALTSNDAKGVERAAHSLKGLIANFGAKEATTLAAELQRFGRDQRLVEGQHVYQRLETEVNLLRRELEGYQARAPHFK